VSTATVPKKDLNPIALQIGELIGLFDRQSDDTYTLNSQWFNDPWQYLSAVPSKPQLLDLIGTLMSSSAGSSLGTPRQLLDHTWYPILNPFKESANPTPTGVYVVAGKPEAGKRTELGFGVLYEWEYDTFTVLPYAYFPLIALPKDANDTFEFILGHDGHPVAAGINVTGSNGIFNTGNGKSSLSLDGFQAGTQIYFESGKYPSLDLLFLNLKLPGDQKGTNRSIADLIENVSVQDSITMALAVLGSQLSKTAGAAATAGKMINTILELLGLTGPVPGIDWSALVKDPSTAVKIFTKWLQDIASTSDTLKAWMNDWYCLMKGLDASDETNHITGTGTREQPFVANLLQAEISPGLTVDFNFSFATVKTPEHALQLFPGFQVTSSPATPIASIPAFGVKLQAAAEILCYTIPASTANNFAIGNGITFFPGYSVMVVAANTDASKPLFSVTDVFGSHEVNAASPATFSLGSMQVGFSYDEAVSGKAGKVPSPNFKLFNVQTAIGSWPVIDLTNFNVNTIEQAIGPAVSQAIKSFFGEDNKYAGALTAVLGIDAPAGYSGDWPLKDQLLLSPAELELLVKNPFAAIGAYYARCLSTKGENDKYLFEYLVPGFATLLGSDSTTVSGDGTAGSPWQIPILQVGTAVLNLSLSRVDDDDLAIAFEFDIPLPVTAVSIVFALKADMMIMKLPGTDGSGRWDASWMQALTANLVVKNNKPGKLQTPALAGVSLAAQDIIIQGGWANSKNFFITAAIEAAELDAGQAVVDLGNIEFSSINWNLDQLKQFAPAIVSGAGLLMIENGGKVGVAVATLLGTLPNISQLYDGSGKYNFPVPEGLKLPADWPVLAIKDFKNPWNDVMAQLSSLYKGDSKFMEPAVRLVGWAINGDTPPEPATIPAGTLEDPWSVNLPAAFGLDFLTWKQDGYSGFGAQRKFPTNVSGSVQLLTLVRADVPGFAVDGATGDNGTHPGIALLNILQNPDPGKPLFDLAGLTIGKVQLGGYVWLQDGQINFAPIFRFIDSKLVEGDDIRTFELVRVPGRNHFECAEGSVVFDALINAMMILLSQTLKSGQFKTLESLLDMLVLLGVADYDEVNKMYSFNPGGWASVTANPGGYLYERTIAMLQNNASCAKLMAALAKLLGYENFNLPKTWQGVQFLLQSLGLVQPYSGFFVPQFSNWLALIKDPVAYLQQSVSNLFNSPDLIRQLLSSLARLVPADNSFFKVDPSGNILTVQIPEDKAVMLGAGLRLFASTRIDVQSLRLTNSVAVGSTVLASAIAFNYSPSFNGGVLSNDYQFYLEGIPDDSPQPFEPLPIWPFPKDPQVYLKQLGFQVPMTLLSAFATKYLNDFVAPVNPAVINIFKVLGLTTTINGEKEQVKPLVGIFMHPVQWLLSPSVLGDDNGSIDLSKLGGLLYNITATGIVNGNIKLQPYEHDGKKDGVSLTGLPWGVTFNFYANTDEGAHLQGNFAPTLPAPAPDIILTAAIAFGHGNGVNIEGSVGLAYELGQKTSGDTTRLAISAAYAKSAFTLTATADTTEFKLLPFGGLNQFLNAGTAGLLLKIIGGKLFGAYNDYVTKNPNTPLKPFVESITVLTGIKDGDTLYTFFKTIYDDPLGQFNEANIQVALPRIYTFVSSILKLDGFTVTEDNKLLQYEHTFTALPGAKVLVTIGLRTINGQTTFGLWLSPVASYQWISLGLDNAGVGVVMPVNYDSPDIVYQVAIDVSTNLSQFNIPNAPEPGIVLGLTGNLHGIQGPTLDFYPVRISNDPGTLQVEILPTAKLVIVGQQDPTVAQWMISFGVDFLIPLIANTALAQPAIKKWLDETTIGTIQGVPGKVLTEFGLLKKVDNSYYLAKLRTAFDVSKPIEIVTKLIFAALNLLDGQRVVPIKDHGIYVTSEKDDDETRYGLRIQIPDIVVTNPQSEGMKLTLQLGKYFGGQDASNNWTGLKTEPGLIVYFINKGATDISFTPKLELVSVGLDFSGPNPQKPLINVKGVTIQAIEPRAYISLDFNGLKTDFGAGMLLHQLGIPLGPGFNNQGKQSNPVAQNLLTSGGNSGNTDAINPAFSVSASYITGSRTFSLQLYDANDIPTDRIWIPIMRAFGPLQCRKIGIGWEGSSNPKRLDFLFDGNVALAGLMLDLMELDIGIPITDPTNFSGYSLDLAGLDLSYNAGAVSIGGSFLKFNTEGYVQYVGQAHIQTTAFGIGAFGAYALIDNHPSLFIFAYLNAPLGGPPFFFLTGLAGGFGYNRTINIPPANQIENFPFVAGIENPSALGGKDGKPPSNEDALRALGTTIVPPQLGSYWLAAGVMFTSFEIIDSKAVLMLIFGNDFEIALVGLTGLKLPKSGYTYVGAQIAFKVTYRVSTGLLAMEAVLTSNSYVIDPNCKLTGGLAFFVWFKDQPDTGAHAGDFVFTLGGYHPRFEKPTYFPDEPRLGFSWSVSSVISIKGGAYFALTPSAIMAGGSLEAVFSSGGLKAWFIAYADFLIMWKPFHYDIGIGISVGVSYTFKIIWTITIKVEVGADLHLWGPEMAGEVTVHLWIISFTIGFGATDTDPNASTIIEWKDFKPYFLPADQAPAPPPQPLPVTEQHTLVAATAPTEVLVQQVTHISQVSGLVKELNDNGETVWQINPGGFTYTVNTVVPLNEINLVKSGQNEDKKITSNAQFGIRPMGNVVFGTPGQMSTLKLTLYYQGTPTDISAWNFTAALNGMPYSLWGTVNDGNTGIDAKIIPNALVGFTASLQSSSDNLPSDGPPMFPLTNLGYAAWPLRKLTLANNPQLHPDSPAVESDKSLQVIQDTVMSTDVVTLRTAILEAVVSAGINVQTNGRLDQMAAYASQTFQSFPMLGSLGSMVLNGTAASPGRLSLVQMAPAAMITDNNNRKPVELRAITVQYGRPALRSSAFMGASQKDVKEIHPVKGRMYAKGLAHDWQVNAINQGRAPSMRNGNNSEGVNSFFIYPGLSMLIDLDGRQEKTQISAEGQVPVFGAWFDEHHQLQGSGIVGAAQQLGKGISEMILTGISTQELRLPYAYGWHVTSQLTLVNPNALTGAGAIIIPDGPVRIRSKRRSAAYGLIMGSRMVERNRIIRNDEMHYAGLETVLPAGLQTVAVLLTGGNDYAPGQAEVRLAIKTSQGPDYQVQKEAIVIKGLTETTLLFSLPADTGYGSYSVHVTTQKGIKVSGVMGLTEREKEVEANWKSVVLQPSVPYPDHAPENETIVTIEQ
jgi:hypothetical protein